VHDEVVPGEGLGREELLNAAVDQRDRPLRRREIVDLDDARDARVDDGDARAARGERFAEEGANEAEAPGDEYVPQISPLLCPTPMIGGNAVRVTVARGKSRRL
jgi:hypothetical protein